MIDLILFSIGALVVIWAAHTIGKNKGVRNGYNFCINELIVNDMLSFKSTDAEGTTGHLVAYDSSISKPGFQIQIKD